MPIVKDAITQIESQGICVLTVECKKEGMKGRKMKQPIVYTTQQGTRYLKEAGVVLISKPAVDLSGMGDFMDDMGFLSYIHDPDELPCGTQLCKVAGQACYMSFSQYRTWNKDAQKYFENILSSGHGSVLEHANYSFFLYGISRSLTHELVRHRHFSFSQVSQRYVSGDKLRFVERPEYQIDDDLHWAFEKRIDQAAWEYRYIADKLLEMQKSENETLRAQARSDLRKKVNQAARSLLPNETEAPMVITGNIRAWRHFVEMRASEHAEIEIRYLAVKIFQKLTEIEPILFSDYVLDTLKDGTQVISTPFRKV